MLQTTLTDADMVQFQSYDPLQLSQSNDHVTTMAYNEGTSENLDGYMCYNCELSFNSRWELMEHKKTQHSFPSVKRSDFNKKVVSCEFCSYKSLNKSDLKRHRMVHTGERPFKCQYCPYSSTRQYNLDKHMHIHCCGHCDFRSGDKMELFNHRQTCFTR